MIRHGAGVADRPLTVVVPTAAGGGADILARILSARMAELLGQPVVIENVGNAVASTNRVAKGQPPVGRDGGLRNTCGNSSTAKSTNGRCRSRRAAP